MLSFLGEYDVKVDAKGRLKLPSGLKKQLQPEDQGRFVLSRGIEQHLTLYPLGQWNKIVQEINKLNPYVKQNREFIRYFLRGATELSLDGNDRLNLPKKLMEYAGIAKDVILFAHGTKIEVWAQDLYDQMIDQEPGDFAQLAEEVMGNLNTNDDNDLKD